MVPHLKKFYRIRYMRLRKTINKPHSNLTVTLFRQTVVPVIYWKQIGRYSDLRCHVKFIMMWDNKHVHIAWIKHFWVEKRKNWNDAKLEGLHLRTLYNSYLQECCMKTDHYITMCRFLYWIKKRNAVVIRSQHNVLFKLMIVHDWKMLAIDSKYQGEVTVWWVWHVVCTWGLHCRKLALLSPYIGIGVQYFDLWNYNFPVRLSDAQIQICYLGSLWFPHWSFNITYYESLKSSTFINIVGLRTRKDYLSESY